MLEDKSLFGPHGFKVTHGSPSFMLQIAIGDNPPKVDFALDFGQVQLDSNVVPVTCKWHLHQVNQLVAKAEELGLFKTEK